jgi:hypothetical protein
VRQGLCEIAPKKDNNKKKSPHNTQTKKMDTSRSSYQEHRRWTERGCCGTKQWSLEYILGQHALAHIDGDRQRVERYNAEWADAIVRSVGGGARGGGGEDVGMRFLRTVRTMVEQFNTVITTGVVQNNATMDTLALFYATISSGGGGACDRRALEEARRHLQLYAYELSYWKSHSGKLVTEADYDHAIATMVTATTLGVWMDAALYIN